MSAVWILLIGFVFHTARTHAACQEHRQFKMNHKMVWSVSYTALSSHCSHLSWIWQIQNKKQIQVYTMLTRPCYLHQRHLITFSIQPGTRKCFFCGRGRQPGSTRFPFPIGIRQRKQPPWCYLGWGAHAQPIILGSYSPVFHRVMCPPPWWFMLTKNVEAENILMPMLICLFDTS